MSRFWKKNKTLLVIAAAVIAIASTFVYRSRAKKAGNGDRIGKVARDTLVQRVTIAGTVAALRSTIVTAPYDGYVKKLFVKL